MCIQTFIGWLVECLAYENGDKQKPKQNRTVKQQLLHKRVYLFLPKLDLLQICHRFSRALFLRSAHLRLHDSCN